MLPRHLWDRANGLDSSIYSLTTVIGPAMAGVTVARFGPEAAFVVAASVLAIAAVSLLGVREPVARAESAGSLIGDALAGLMYVVRHPSLRGLAITLFICNLGFGVLPVGIPVLVLRHFHGSAATVGQVFAVFGLAGLVTGLIIGRVNTEGRERLLIAGFIGVQGVALALLAFANALPMVFVLAAVVGGAESVVNVGLFALRQRRTDPALFGRAFAVSMSLNFAGLPIGSAISGPLLEQSIVFPLLLGAAISVIAVAAGLVLIPVRGPSEVR
jgi:predicted MFS family arabinose efflux permease